MSVLQNLFWALEKTLARAPERKNWENTRENTIENTRENTKENIRENTRENTQRTLAAHSFIPINSNQQRSTPHMHQSITDIDLLWTQLFDLPTMAVTSIYGMDANKPSSLAVVPSCHSHFPTGSLLGFPQGSPQAFQLRRYPSEGSSPGEVWIREARG